MNDITEKTHLENEVIELSFLLATVKRPGMFNKSTKQYTVTTNPAGHQPVTRIVASMESRKTSHVRHTNMKISWSTDGIPRGKHKPGREWFGTINRGKMIDAPGDNVAAHCLIEQQLKTISGLPANSGFY